MQEVEIRVKGQIDREWSRWFGTISITHGGAGETLLRGVVRDQSALYGLIERLSSLGLQLMSVTVKASTADTDEEARRDVKRT